MHKVSLKSIYPKTPSTTATITRCHGKSLRKETSHLRNSCEDSPGLQSFAFQSFSVLSTVSGFLSSFPFLDFFLGCLTLAPVLTPLTSWGMATYCQLLVLWSHRRENFCSPTLVENFCKPPLHTGHIVPIKKKLKIKEIPPSRALDKIMFFIHHPSLQCR